VLKSYKIFRNLGVIEVEKILNEIVDKSFAELVKDTQDIISIKSVLDESSIREGAPFGTGIAQALETMLSKASAMGLQTKNVEGYAGYAQLGAKGEQIAILAHLDVVPAAGEWLVPPYSAQVVDGKLYGRGSTDDKGPAMACLYALKAIKDSGLAISKRARLILGTDEESFSRGIKYYLQKEEAPACGFSPDAEFPIIHAEKGLIHFLYSLKMGKNEANIISLEGGTRINVVPDLATAIVAEVTEEDAVAQIRTLGLEKYFTVEIDVKGIKITSRGISGHASLPQKGYNAIQNMLQLLAVLFPKNDTPLNKFITYFAKHLKTETNGISLGIFCQDEISGELTINTAIIDMDANKAIMKFDIRYPVTCDGEKILQKLRALAGKLDADFELIQHMEPLYVEKDSPLIKVLQETYKDCTGEEPVLLAIGGGTYCRSVKNTVSFGPVFPGQPELAHQCNEYIALEDLRRMTKIYAQGIYNLIR
jgi:succinyl-diaminopimelate desuccinylase